MTIDTTLPLEEQIAQLQAEILALQKRVYGPRPAPEVAQMPTAQANTLALENAIAQLQQAVNQINYRLNAGAGVNNIYQFAEGGGVLRVPDMLSGNAGDPRDTTNPFTGTALLYPPLAVGSKNYNFIGMKNGKLQVGISSDDGTLYGAGGLFQTDADGINYNGFGVFSQASVLGYYDHFFIGGMAIGTSLRFGIHSFSYNNSGASKITNGDFETGALTGWTLTGTPTIYSDSPSGVYSVRVTDTDYISQTFATTAGHYYLIVCNIKTESGSSAAITGTGLTQIESGAGTNPSPWPSTTWQKVIALVKASGATITLNFQQWTSNPGGIAYFDNIAVYDLLQYTYQGALVDGMGSYRLSSSVNATVESPIIYLTAATSIYATPVSIAESATPTTPAAGYGIIYPKSDHLWYIKDSAGNEKAIGLDVAASYQPLDSDLTAIAGLSPTNDDIIQRKAGAWTNRTMAQLAADLTTLAPLASPTFTGTPAAPTAAQGTNTTQLATTAFTQTEIGAKKSADIMGGHGVGGTVPASTTYYIVPMINGLDTAGRSYPWPKGGTIKNLYIRTSGGQPATGTLVFSLVAAGSATGLTVTVAAGAGAGTYSDTTHTYTHTGGDLITLQVTNNATSASAGIGGCSWEIDYGLV